LYIINWIISENDMTMEKISPGDLARLTKKYNLGSWMTQNDWKPITMERAKGCYFWDTAGRQYLDWCSQMINVNIGHGNEEVNRAISEQLKKMTFAAPSIATEIRAKAAVAVAEVTPGNHTKCFFTTAGADANENAMKIARLYTGKHKIISRYRAYHGGTFAAMSAGGDPRRIANEPGVPWIVRVHDPYAYRNPVYDGRSQEEGDAILVQQMEDTIIYEGADSIAAIIMEGFSGSVGSFDGGEVYWNGIQHLCDKYGILLIIDEILSGFGRTGKWFAFQHHPGLKPDIITMAKGLTSAYVAMGAVSVSDEIAAYFDNNPLWAGLTYSAHPLGCAAAVAVLKVMHDNDLVVRSAAMGEILSKGLFDLAEKHPCIGDVRGKGLHHVLELVKNRQTREPMSPYHQPLTEPMVRMKKLMLENGLYTLIRWNLVFSFPPLIIEEAQIREGLEVLDAALAIGDEYVND
jgi:taurine--2-oxoglutarate transaminase